MGLAARLLCLSVTLVLFALAQRWLAYHGSHMVMIAEAEREDNRRKVGE
jgi:hypothetical protein